MKNISTNKLQNELSRVIREVETGEVFQVARYSKPVAYLVPKADFEKMIEGSDCKKCVSDLRKITIKLKDQK